MKKFVAILLAVLCVCLSFSALGEEGITMDYRSAPGYTSYPLNVDSEDYYGHFFVEVPMEWDGGDASFGYGVPTAIAIDPEDQSHIVLVAEMTLYDQLIIMQNEEHPLYAFLRDGMEVAQGRSTVQSKILEQFDIHGIPATKVEMVGQGFEMIWIQDKLDEDIPLENLQNVGALWFFMYPADPAKTEYTAVVESMIDSFTICGIYGDGPECVKSAEASDFEYTVLEDGVRLDAYVGEKEYVEIPARIEGKPVTSLGDGVFYETPVRNVVFPECVSSIGANTFGGCNDLVYAVMPPLDVLPQGTFESCFRLLDPDLSMGVKKIEDTAFWSNMFLQTLFLPEEIEEIEQNAFTMCDNLSCIYMNDNGNGHYVTNEDHTLLMSADGEQLVFYSWLNEDETYRVPDGVKRINAYAFQDARMKEIILPEGLDSIGMNAFTRTQITELTIPASVTEIGPLRNAVNEDGDPVEAQYLSVGEKLKVIHGTPGTAAEKYAELHHLTFVAE